VRPAATSSPRLVVSHAYGACRGRRQYYYFYLTEEGINYLRDYLSLPKDVAPQTHMKREARPARPGPPGGGESRSYEQAPLKGHATDRPALCILQVTASSRRRSAWAPTELSSSLT
jgi:hypothetical protein